MLRELLESDPEKTIFLSVTMIEQDVSMAVKLPGRWSACNNKGNEEPDHDWKLSISTMPDKRTVPLQLLNNRLEGKPDVHEDIPLLLLEFSAQGVTSVIRDI
ncbi:MAG: hypothetical protein WC952_13755 [Desulfobulbaceae bacterium]